MFVSPTFVCYACETPAPRGFAATARYNKTVDLINNVYLKTTLGEKPDDKTADKEVSWLAKLNLASAGVAGLNRTSIDKVVLKTDNGRH